MVKVATNLDLPIKLLWPKSLAFASDAGYTMLGLGDIVIPGTFIALALRYDYYRHAAAAHDTPLPASGGAGYPKPYFTAALVAYVLGLVTTMSVMHVFRAAQPALLYLSPACILSFVITAATRGELGTAWAWSDDPAKDKEEAKKKLEEEEEEARKKGSASAAPVVGEGESARLLEQSGQSGYGAVMKGAGAEAEVEES
jgi:minor histocompatibility antigen H13